MNKSNITFEVTRSNTCVLKKCPEKNIFSIIFVIIELECCFCWNNVGSASQTVSQHYISISRMHRVSCEVILLATREERLTCTQSKQTLDNHPTLCQCWTSIEDCGSALKQHWVNVLCLLMCWRKVYSRPSVGLVLGQPHRRLTGIEPAMGCDADQILNRNWVGRPTS